jgi:hypothetical protein
MACAGALLWRAHAARRRPELEQRVCGHCSCPTYPASLSRSGRAHRRGWHPTTKPRVFTAKTYWTCLGCDKLLAYACLCGAHLLRPRIERISAHYCDACLRPCCRACARFGDALMPNKRRARRLCYPCLVLLAYPAVLSLATGLPAVLTRVVVHYVVRALSPFDDACRVVDLAGGWSGTSGRIRHHDGAAPVGRPARGSWAGQRRALRLHGHDDPASRCVRFDVVLVMSHDDAL